MKTLSFKWIIVFTVAVIAICNDAEAKNWSDADMLNGKAQSIVTIAAFTATGDLPKLATALHSGLDSGLTINEIKEVIVHVYAYCGFPRSIRGLQTFMEVLDTRKGKGIQDNLGIVPSSINNEDNKYDRGKKILGELTKAPQDRPLSGYSAFAPVIDTFLKEHLFADIFERDVLTYPQRELATISVLSSIGGVEPMLRGHFSICLNVGITPQQLRHFISIIGSSVGKEKAEAAKTVLNEVLQNRPLN